MRVCLCAVKNRAVSNRKLESRMREIRPYGSEGEARLKPLFLPLSNRSREREFALTFRRMSAGEMVSSSRSPEKLAPTPVGGYQS